MIPLMKERYIRMKWYEIGLPNMKLEWKKALPGAVPVPAITTGV